MGDRTLLTFRKDRLQPSSRQKSKPTMEGSGTAIGRGKTMKRTLSQSAGVGNKIGNANT